jgi:hypothetical protein
MLDTIGKTLYCSIKLCSDFLYKSETFLIPSRIHLDIRCICMLSTHYSCQISVKVELSRDIFEKKYSDIEFHGNMPSGNGFVTWGRTDRHDEANSRFSQILQTRLKKSDAIPLCECACTIIDQPKNFHPTWYEHQAHTTALQFLSYINIVTLTTHNS